MFTSVSLCVLVAILVHLPASTASRVPAHHGTYWVDAAHNLSRWRSSIFREAETLAFNESPPGHAQFALYNPVVSCPPATQATGFGEGDGRKVACYPFDKVGSMESKNQGPESSGCIVYSIGSNNQYDFEEAILNKTNCMVYTFDCTVTQGRSLGPRHTFHKICVGTKAMAIVNPLVMTLGSLIRFMNHTYVSYLKMDIEGYEYDVFAAFSEEDILPDQVAFEFHGSAIYIRTKHMFDKAVVVKNKTHLFWNREVATVQEMAFMMLHLGNIGYAVVSREDNPFCPFCSELVIIRVEKTKWVVHGSLMEHS